jgi:predicted RNase H-like nuclease (RuvC/YqgF family)
MFSDVTIINLSEELKHLQSTNDEQKEKISEYERQIENKGRNVFSKLKQELQNTFSYDIRYKAILDIPCAICYLLTDFDPIFQFL